MTQFLFLGERKPSSVNSSVRLNLTVSQSHGRVVSANARSDFILTHGAHVGVAGLSLACNGFNLDYPFY